MRISRKIGDLIAPRNPHALTGCCFSAACERRNAAIVAGGDVVGRYCRILPHKLLELKALAINSILGGNAPLEFVFPLSRSDSEGGNSHAMPGEVASNFDVSLSNRLFEDPEFSIRR
jgi:hypothetical protein